MRSLAQTQSHLVIFLLDKQIYLLQFFLQHSPAFKPLQSLEPSSILVDETILSKQVDKFKVVFLANCVVVVVMSWSDLDATCSKLSVHHLISHYYHLSLRNEGMDQFLSDEVFESRVFRMNCYSSISQHCFNSGCSYVNKFGWVILECISEC